MTGEEKHDSNAVDREEGVKPMKSGRGPADGAPQKPDIKSELSRLKDTVVQLGDGLLTVAVAALQIFIAFIVGKHFGSVLYGVFTWIGLEMVVFIQHQLMLDLDPTKDVHEQVEEHVRANSTAVNQQTAIIFTVIAVALRVAYGF